MLHRAYFNLGNAPFAYHELSDLVSGPVILPKIYNGKNRTFFLFGWSRHNETYNQYVFADVPTQAKLGGDFSFNGLGYPIYDPATIKQDAAGKWTATQFPGNIIPQSRFDPVAVNFLGHQPWNAPNNPGGSGLIAADWPTPELRRQYILYVDANSFRYQNRSQHQREKSFLRPLLAGPESLSRQRECYRPQLVASGRISVLAPSDQINSVISDTHVFSPTLVNEVRLGANHRKESRNPPGSIEDWAQQLGIPGVSGATFPSFFNSSGTAFYNASMPGAPYYQADEN